MTTHQATAINLHMAEERPAPAVQNPPAATMRDRLEPALYTIVMHDDGGIEANRQGDTNATVGEVTGPYIKFQPWRHTVYLTTVVAASVGDALDQGEEIADAIVWD